MRKLAGKRVAGHHRVRLSLSLVLPWMHEAVSLTHLARLIDAILLEMEQEHSHQRRRLGSILCFVPGAQA